jgi:hypothetical protein
MELARTGYHHVMKRYLAVTIAQNLNGTRNFTN